MESSPRLPAAGVGAASPVYGSAIFHRRLISTLPARQCRSSTAVDPSGVDVREDRTERKAADVEPAEGTVVYQASAVVPEWPADVADRRPGGCRTGHDVQRAQCSGSGQQDEPDEGRERTDRDGHRACDVHAGDGALVEQT